MERIKPLKFRWNLIIASAMWIFTAICYEAGVIYWQDFTFVHTFLAPAVLLVAFAPLSVRHVVSSPLLRPGMAVWAGVMVPVVYLTGRRLTGFGHHCDRASVIAGIIVFSTIFLRWAIVTFCRRKLVRAIQAAIA